MPIQGTRHSCMSWMGPGLGTCADMQGRSGALFTTGARTQGAEQCHGVGDDRCAARHPVGVEVDVGPGTVAAAPCLPSMAAICDDAGARGRAEGECSPEGFGDVGVPAQIRTFVPDTSCHVRRAHLREPGRIGARIAVASHRDRIYLPYRPFRRKICWLRSRTCPGMHAAARRTCVRNMHSHVLMRLHAFTSV